MNKNDTNSEKQNTKLPLLDLSFLFSPQCQNATSIANFQEIQDLVQQVKHIGQNIGFFYIKNHCVSENLLNDMQKQQKLLFDLPLEQKMSFHQQKGKDYSGYTYLGEEITLGKRDMKETVEYFNLKEGLNLKKNDENLQKYASAFLQQQKYPSQNLLPQFQETVETYIKQMNILGQNLMKVFALAMGVNENYFTEQKITDNNFSILRMNCYTPKNKQFEKINENERGIGIGEHVDPGWLILLNQGEIGGLQVLDQDNQWIDATPVPGTLIVNMGEVMQIASNGMFKATPHRVLNPIIQKKRLSTVVFFDPNLDAAIKPIGYNEKGFENKIKKNDFGDIQVAQNITENVDLDIGVVYGNLVLSQYQRGYPNKNI